MNELLNKLSLELQKLLNLHNIKIGTAESCTGGMLAQYLTKHPGSSQTCVSANKGSPCHSLNLKGVRL